MGLDVGFGEHEFASAHDGLDRALDHPIQVNDVSGNGEVMSGQTPVLFLSVMRHRTMKVQHMRVANLAPEARLQEVAHEWMEAQRRVGQFGAPRYQPEALRFVKCLSGVLDRPVTTLARTGSTAWRIDVRMRNACSASSKVPTTSSAK